MCVCIYIYIFVCVGGWVGGWVGVGGCVCTYIYVYVFLIRPSSRAANPFCRAYRSRRLDTQLCTSMGMVVYLVPPHRPPLQPLQDILLLRVVCARINRPFIPRAHLYCPQCCQYCCTTIGRYKTPLRSPLCMPYTIQYWQWQ